MPRGRPRQFNEDDALTSAMLLFWEKGLSATSLDDLALAMNMNRPSIYNAFGSKNDLYRKTLARFCSQLDGGLQEILDAAPKVRPAFIAFFNQAIEVYCGNNPPMGCLMICTAPAEALSHPQVGDDLRDLIRRLDDGFARRLQRAQRDGEVSRDLQPKLAAKLLQATLQTLALRARSGASKASLRKIARYAVEELAR
ncbi:MAG: TetR/AcrR family transcriptional regulator [Gammaproteobacteria bacterium]|nr:TetR/AcrR family transcriptional regulator [Gammaproteobacteria bacterium]